MDFSTRFRGVIITGLEDELKEFHRSLRTVSACSCLKGSLLFQIIGHTARDCASGLDYVRSLACSRDKLFHLLSNVFLSFVTMRMVAVATWSLWVLRETHRCLQCPLWCDRGRTTPHKTPIRWCRGTLPCVSRSSSWQFPAIARAS